MNDKAYLCVIGALKTGSIQDIMDLAEQPERHKPIDTMEAVRATLRRLEREGLIEWHPDSTGLRLTATGFATYCGIKPRVNQYNLSTDDHLIRSIAI